jgi:hypothetical protein
VQQEFAAADPAGLELHQLTVEEFDAFPAQRPQEEIEIHADPEALVVHAVFAIDVPVNQRRLVRKVGAQQQAQSGANQVTRNGPATAARARADDAGALPGARRQFGERSGVREGVPGIQQQHPASGAGRDPLIEGMRDAAIRFTRESRDAAAVALDDRLCAVGRRAVEDKVLYGRIVLLRHGPQSPFDRAHGIAADSDDAHQWTGVSHCRLPHGTRRRC